MSGGRATLRSRKGRGMAVVAQVGDISAIAEVGHPFLRLFAIECKFYADLKLASSLIYGKKGFLEDIWYKPLGEARAIDREPFVVLRENRRDELVWTTAKGLAWLRKSVRPGCELKCFGAYPIHGIHKVHLRDVVLSCDPLVLQTIAGQLPEPTPRPPVATRVSKLRRQLFSEIPKPRHSFTEIEAERQWSDELARASGGRAIFP